MISTHTIRHGTQDRPIQEEKECTTQSMAEFARCLTSINLPHHLMLLADPVKLTVIYNNNNCLKSNIQCIEIRVQWTVHIYITDTLTFAFQLYHQVPFLRQGTTPVTLSFEYYNVTACLVQSSG